MLGTVLKFIINNPGYVVVVVVVAILVRWAYQKAREIGWGGGPALLAGLVTFVMVPVVLVAFTFVAVNVLRHAPWYVNLLFNAAVDGATRAPAPKWAANFEGSEWVEGYEEPENSKVIPEGSSICPKGEAIPKGTPYKVWPKADNPNAGKWIVSKLGTWGKSKLTGNERDGMCETNLYGSVGTVYVSPP